MASATLKRFLVNALIAVGAMLWLAALLLMAHTAQNTDQFGLLHNWILLLNAAGVVVLLVLIGVNLSQLVRDYRRHLGGSRLKARMVTMFVMLAIAPLLLVFYFSVQFLHRGIDSWFHVEIEQGLSNALSLSRAALNLRMKEHLESTQIMARELGSARELELVSQLSVLRRNYGAAELTVSGQNSRILATSAERPGDGVPSPPSEEIMLQVRQGHPYVNLDTDPAGGYVIRTAAPVAQAVGIGESRVLLATFPVGERLGDLARTVDEAYQEYLQIEFLRQPLKVNFTLTLTLVLLLSLLAAVYGAFYFAQRLVEPIQQLVAGTRAVAKGDFDTRLPMGARDEIGFLVNSFNDMTKRLARAREETRRSQQAVESERANLEVILARLSTGVVSLEPDLRIRTANQAAGAILGVELEQRVGEPLGQIVAGNPLLEQFVAAAQAHLEAGETDWREQIVLRAEVGRRVLMCACTTLPGKDEQPGGYVVVFDDITALLQAQRDAAWAEVARRLAHEIKNPLTPIQLSAERMRQKFLNSMNEKDAQLLERATHTIVQQVEAMKAMVNAFSEYARSPDMQLSEFDLNQLVAEVVELYRGQGTPVQLRLVLDPRLPPIEADRVRIRQLLHNLITNAVEALTDQPDGRVEIISRHQQGTEQPEAELVVRDNGPGFQMDTIERIFDPYVTSKPKGTGLGLAIVKKIVEEHGGRIEADNREEGGARVRIVLPISEQGRSAGPRVRKSTELRRQRA